MGSAVAAALIVVGFLAAPSVDHAFEAEKVKIMVPTPSTASTPLYHAQAAGYFAEEGIDVEIMVIPGAASIQSVIARDPVHIAISRRSAGLRALSSSRRTASSRAPASSTFPRHSCHM